VKRTIWGEIATSNDTEWLIDSIIPKGKQVHLFGPSGVGKSLLALHLALSIIEGSEALSRYPAKPGTVMYIDYENGPSIMKERLQDYGYKWKDFDWFEDKFYVYCFPEIESLDTTEAEWMFLREVERSQADIVVIDSFGLAIDGDENSSDAYRRFGRGLGRTLREMNVAALMLDNTGKDPHKGSRGSSRKKDEADVQWLLTSTAPDTYQLSLEKDRIGGSPKAIAFTQTYENGFLQWVTPKPKQISHEAAMIVKQMKEKNVSPQSQRAARELGITGTQRYVNEAVQWVKVNYPKGFEDRIT